MESITTVVFRIHAGEGKIYVCGGIESMSNIPLVYSEEYPDRSAASKREYEIKKKMTRDNKLDLMAKIK